MSSLLDRIRGKCPPSLLFEGTAGGPKFDDEISHLLEPNGIALLSTGTESFLIQVKALDSLSRIPSDSDDTKKSFLQARRAVILAVVQQTKDTKTLEELVDGGYLNAIKLWLDQILDGTVGSMDFLLHLLSSIIHLPVDKAIVKESGMGKAIGSLAKDKFCRGPNENAVQERVDQIKDAWHASVKARKVSATPDVKKEPTQEDPKPLPSSKRKITTEESSPETKRKIKIEAPPPKKVKSNPGFSMSALLEKVSGNKTLESKETTKWNSTQVPKEEVPAPSPKAEPSDTAIAKQGSNKEDPAPEKRGKKASKRVKWADHFGIDLEKKANVDGAEENSGAEEKTEVSWADRKKRDRLREKELLAKVKRAKLLDDDEYEPELPQPVKPTIPWELPVPLPPNENNPGFSSPEVELQTRRLQTVPEIRYKTILEVPPEPSPRDDIEQALDMTSHSSAKPIAIPFFAPPIPVEPPPEPVPVVPPTSIPHHPAVASAEFVQSLGLPFFLVGQDTQALLTLAQSPGLLNTMVDANGMYDQPRLLTLVQTLSSAPSVMTGQTPMNYPVPYTYSQPLGALPQGGSSLYSATDGNLHVSNFGPTTTSSDLVALFSPYVKVDEVVMKGSFAFVNTSDPFNAQQAREALDGTFLGGMSIKINPATRRNKEPSMSSLQPNYASQRVPSAPVTHFHPPPPPPVPSSLHTLDNDPQAIAHAETSRDDRGNPATKNLFVAGYGGGTTEQQLRDLFGQYCTVVGVILKGNFSFVNTSDKVAAVRARDMLKGVNLNGGSLRINFAKETGRLGTSFDLTYNQSSGPNGPRPPAPMGSQPSYYTGRGF